MTTNILLYMKVYSCYTRRCIMTTNIFIIHESVFLLYETMYNDNIYFSLYKKIYNDNEHFLYQEMFVVIIRDDV